jgi:hypothetical protein
MNLNHVYKGKLKLIKQCTLTLNAWIFVVEIIIEYLIVGIIIEYLVIKHFTWSLSLCLSAVLIVHRPAQSHVLIDLFHPSKLQLAYWTKALCMARLEGHKKNLKKKDAIEKRQGT